MRNRRKIRQDEALLTLAQEISELHRNNSLLLHEKVAEYRKELDKNGIKAIGLNNKAIFQKYIEPVINPGRLEKLMDRFFF